MSDLVQFIQCDPALATSADALRHKSKSKDQIYVFLLNFNSSCGDSCLLQDF